MANPSGVHQVSGEVVNAAVPEPSPRVDTQANPGLPAPPSMADVLRADPALIGLDPKRLSRNKERVARFIAMGFDNQVIAKLTGLRWQTVWVWRNDDKVAERAAMHKELQRAVLAEYVDEFDNLIPKALESLNFILSDDGVAPSVKEKAAAQVFDRHPSGKFVRQRKTQTEVTHHVDNTAIDELKRIAARTNAEVIDVQPCSPQAAPVEPTPHPSQPKSTGEHPTGVPDDHPLPEDAGDPRAPREE